MLTWVLWALLLMAQNAAFTWVSRARNSGSVGYHAVASVASNGVWIVSQVILVGSLLDVIRTSDWFLGIIVALFYTTCTVAGAVLMHWVSLRYLETGKRKVGA